MLHKQHHDKNICSSGLKVQPPTENDAQSCRVVTSILGHVPEFVPSCFFPLCFGLLEQTACWLWRDWRAQHCVYIWSQISLMDEEEWTTCILFPLRSQVIQIKNTTSSKDFQNKTPFLDECAGFSTNSCCR